MSTTSRAALSPGTGAHSSPTTPFELPERAPGEFAAQGALTFATARAARELGLTALRQASGQSLRIDCSGITASDSAGMTVLLDWLAFARGEGRSLRYENLPSQVQAIARISDVLELLERGV